MNTTSTRIPFASTLLTLSLALTACSGKTLDGGQAKASSDAGTAEDSAATEPDASTGQGDGGSSTVVSSKPVSGSIDATTFTLEDGDVTLVTGHDGNKEYLLSLQSYKGLCGDVPSNEPNQPDALIVNIGAVPPKIGTFTVAYADEHGATFQHGLYEDSSKATVVMVKSGTVTIDSWSEGTGALVTGTIDLVGKDGASKVSGAFEATLCPAN
ncbi:MAG: hypothetical protein KC766_17225 [Myxococcales bacterium]|nr:hypothetical protein [Myxococcales bacterium]